VDERRSKQSLNQAQPIFNDCQMCNSTGEAHNMSSKQKQPV